MPVAPHRCQGCDRRWTGLVECHCGECHRHFSSEKPFDVHRDSFHCVNPVKLRRLFAVQRADGPVWTAR